MLLFWKVRTSWKLYKQRYCDWSSIYRCLLELETDAKSKRISEASYAEMFKSNKCTHWWRLQRITQLIRGSNVSEQVRPRTIWTFDQRQAVLVVVDTIGCACQLLSWQFARADEAEEVEDVPVQLRCSAVLQITAEVVLCACELHCAFRLNELPCDAAAESKLPGSTATATAHSFCRLWAYADDQ